MNELNNHYRMLLGLDDAMLLKSLDLSMESKRAVNAYEHRGGRLTCSEWGILLHTSLIGPGERAYSDAFDDFQFFCHL